MLSSAGRLDDAAAVRARGIELCEALVAEPPDTYEYLVRLTELYRDELEARGRAATTQHVRTCIERVSALYKRSLVAARDPAKSPDEDPRVELGHRWRELAFVLRDIGRNEEAERIFRSAIEAFEQSRSLNPPYAAHFIGDTLRRIGRLQVLSGKLGDAEQSFRRALEIHAERAAKFPDFRINQVEQAAAYLDLARLLINSGRAQEAGPLINRAAQFDDPEVQNEVAWCLVANPEPSFHSYPLAVELAERAIAARPGDGDIWNTLAVARYRNGQPKEAIAAFERSMQLRYVGDGSNRFFLAMGHWQLGNKDEAREWYDKAVGWINENHADSQHLRRLRMQAEELLKIAGPATKEAN
jgi:tetratricopeptide (TPR) repeat protein